MPLSFVRLIGRFVAEFLLQAYGTAPWTLTRRPVSPHVQDHGAYNQLHDKIIFVAALLSGFLTV